MKTYQGLYKIKNPSKYEGDATNVVFRSMWERHCFKWCDENPHIKSWVSEEIVVPYFYDVDKKYHRYFVDLKITYKDGRTVLVEIKPEKQTNAPKKSGSRNTQRFVNEAMTYVKNMNKWEAAESFAKDRGWEWQIWTEKTLQEMGIMPKKLKPLKPIRKKPKVRR